MAGKTIVDAIETLLERREERQLTDTMGTVVSVSGGIARVAIGNTTNTQEAEVSSGTSVEPGDRCLLSPVLHNPKIRWAISTVFPKAAKPGPNQQLVSVPSGLRSMKGTLNHAVFIWDPVPFPNAIYDIEVADTPESEARRRSAVSNTLALVPCTGAIVARVRAKTLAGGISPWSGWAPGSPGVVEFKQELGDPILPAYDPRLSESFIDQDTTVAALLEATQDTYVREVTVQVLEVFPSGRTLKIGEAGTPERFIAEAEVNLQKLGSYTVFPRYRYEGDATVQAILSGTGSGGSARILISL